MHCCKVFAITFNNPLLFKIDWGNIVTGIINDLGIIDDLGIIHYFGIVANSTGVVIDCVNRQLIVNYTRNDIIRSRSLAWSSSGRASRRQYGPFKSPFEGPIKGRRAGAP